jgi:hypothetical protein
VNPADSKRITDKINVGDLSEKPGWVRMSMHPTMANGEVLGIIDAIKEIAENIDSFQKDYIYSLKKNEFFHKSSGNRQSERVKGWFNIST